ncbi:MAG: polysaccharide deacetylase family protein [Gemmatimonadota bacterium]
MTAPRLPALVRLIRRLPGALRHLASAAVGPAVFRQCLAGQCPLPAQPTAVLSFDCDFPADVRQLPTVAGQLAAHGLRGSFAVVGQWVERYPAEHRALVMGGHEIINHTHTHPNLRNDRYDFAAGPEFTERRFASLTAAERRDEIMGCHRAVAEVMGVVMQGCRLPHFGNLDPEEIYGLLLEVDYHFSSSELAVLSPALGAPYAPRPGLWEIPVTGCPRHPFVAFDTWHCLVKDGGRHSGPGQFRSLLMEAVSACEERGALLNLYFDPKDVAANPDFDALLERLAATPQVRVVTYAELLVG